MLARGAARSGQARRSGRRKAVAAPARLRANVPEQPSELDEWVEAEIEAEEDRNRLEEGEMEILLTGHAATHGFEDEDNWLIKSGEDSWRER